MKPSRRFDDLVAILDRLRGPDGCPWDREQTYETLRGYLLEECYEVVEALDTRDREALKEELGDLLLQVVFLSRLAKEEAAFDVGDVIGAITDKMIRRHPHVFGEASAEDAEEVLRHWEAIKRQEKAARTGDEATGSASVLDGVPQALPALLKASRLGTKAARVGFDWKDAASALEKVEEEIRELRGALESGRREAVRDELGDALFALAMLGRKLELDPEEALEHANRKFQRRFRALEAKARAAGRALGGSDSDSGDLEPLWEEVKQDEGSSGPCTRNRGGKPKMSDRPGNCSDS